MSINIKNKEAERLLAEIKRKTGKGTSQLVLELLRAERDRLGSKHKRDLERAMKATRALQKAWAEAEVIDPRPIDEIVGYDENGLPR